MIKKNPTYVLSASLVTVLLAGVVVKTGWTQNGQGAAKASQPATGNKYQQAKDHLKQARALLRDYLATNPTGDEAYYANLQLKALDNLIVTDIPIAPVPMKKNWDITWRVLAVDVQEAYTKVTLELHNTNENRQDSFLAFDSHPLSIVANTKVYDMKTESTKKPATIRTHKYGQDMWWDLEGGQAVKIDVYFDALDAGVTDGQIKFKFNNEATPIKFSLLNTNQKPANK